MKKFLISLLFGIMAIGACAQIPYFAPTVGHMNLYGYTSLKFRPTINTQETYTTFQFGLGKYFATGLDLYTSGNSVYGGVLVRAGYKFNDGFSIGGQVTPSFNVDDDMGFSYLTTGLYMNGNIIHDGKLFWNSNTWYTVDDSSDYSVQQYLYLGTTFNLPHNQKITPMIGTIYSWKFDDDPDLALGAYWTVERFNFYLWGNDFFKDDLRIVAGIDFTLSTK